MLDRHAFREGVAVKSGPVRNIEESGLGSRFARRSMSRTAVLKPGSSGGSRPGAQRQSSGKINFVGSDRTYGARHVWHNGLNQQFGTETEVDSPPSPTPLDGRKLALRGCHHRPVLGKHPAETTASIKLLC